MRRPAQPRIPDETYDLGYRICTDGWQKAVAWRLSGALNDRTWANLRRRPRGLCAVLARTATAVEDAASAAGQVAGLAVATATRWLRLTRLAQKIAQVVVTNAVPSVGENLTAMVARFLRIIGIWICVSSDRSLRSCPSFEGLVSGHTNDWVEERLLRELDGLRAAAAQ